MNGPRDLVKVLHVSPVGFGADAIVGGGERYAYELARAMARLADVRLLTFGSGLGLRRVSDLVLEDLPAGRLRQWHPLAANPCQRRFAHLARWADVVHAHQVATFTTTAAVLLGRVFGKATFVTDLGGGHPYAPTSYLPILRGCRAMLLLSDYSRRLWADTPGNRRPDRLEVVRAGVDLDRFSPAPGRREPGHVLFVGRVLAHKGIEHLIDAIEPPMTLTIVGRQYDAGYARALESRAVGRSVTFRTEVEEADLADYYRRAMVTVLPSVYETAGGGRTLVPELFGLVVLESMACGTPAIVSNVAALPEIVEDGRTGFIVPPNDAGAIRDRLRHLLAHPDEVERMGRAGRVGALERFGWDAVARRCLAAYGGGNGGRP